MELKNIKTTVIIPVISVNSNLTEQLEFLGDKNIQVILADGCENNELEKKINQYQFKNIKYIYSGPDNTLSEYINKMHHAINQVQTQFCMTLDQGDFLNLNTLEKCENLLNKQKVIKGINGKIIQVKKTGSIFINPETKNYLNKTNDLISWQDLIEAKEYFHMWYALQELETFKKSWNIIRNNELRHPLMEYVPCFTILNTGYFYQLPDNFILRIEKIKKDYKKPLNMFYPKESQNNVFENFIEKSIDKKNLTLKPQIESFFRRNYNAINQNYNCESENNYSKHKQIQSLSICGKIFPKLKEFLVKRAPRMVFFSKLGVTLVLKNKKIKLRKKNKFLETFLGKEHKNEEM